MNKTNNYFSFKQIVSFAIVLVLLSVQSVSALTSDDFKYLYTPFVDESANICDDNSTIKINASVYVIGDSLTVGMRDFGDLEKKLKDTGWTVPQILANTGQTVGQSLALLEDDENISKAQDVDVFIVALGTTPETSFEDKLKSLVARIRVLSVDATIYWMNAYTPTADNAQYKITNANIRNQSSAKNFRVIDFESEAKSNSSEYPFAADGIHHTGAGYEAKASYTQKSVGSAGPSSGSGAELVGGDNEEQVWHYLRSQGFTPPMTAGIMGNMQAEAHFEPRLVEYGWLNSRGEESRPGSPTSLDDNIPPNQNNLGQPGYGIVQWTSPNRKDGLRDVAARNGTIGGHLGSQLEYLMVELTGSYRNSTYNPILATKDLSDEESLNKSTDIFLYEFERPANASSKSPQRRQMARDILVRYGSKNAPPPGSGANNGQDSNCSEEDDEGSGSGDEKAGSKIVGDPYTDSGSVDCAEGTEDLGLDEGYESGRKFTVRLCALSNLSSAGSASNPNSLYYVNGANGRAIVNSRASGAWYRLVEDAKAAGKSLSANSSFRSMREQQALCYSNAQCRNGDYSWVAKPGTSGHQAGVAIDFSDMYDKGGQSCGEGSRATATFNPSWIWLRDNAHKYGFKQYSAEAWHWDALDASNRC
jgi:lysophospholipase L1-like esterase